jgi:translation initiation factor RLI1
MMIDPLQESDIYPINQIKSISYEGKDYLCLQIDDHDIIEGEELGLLSDNKIGKSLFVKKVLQNYLLTSKEKIDFNLNYSCLQLNKNITIEGLV